MTFPDASSTPLPSDASAAIDPAAAAPDPAHESSSLFGDFLLGALTWTTRGATAMLVLTGVGGLAAIGLEVGGQMPAPIADPLQQRCLVGAIGSAALAMVSGAVRSAIVEQHRRAERERQRVAAARAHHEAYLARIAAREAEEIAEQAAAERRAADIESAKRELAARVSQEPPVEE